MSITELPELDRTADDFKDTCDEFFGEALPQFVDEVNALIANITAAANGGGFTIGYIFSTTTTDSDPGVGHLRLSNATQNAATTIRTDLSDVAGTTWTTVLDTFDDSTSTIKGQIRLTKLTDGSKWLAYSVTAIASPAGYRNITVANVGGSAASPFADGDYVMLTFTRTGDKGDQGVPGTDAATAIQYTFDTTTTDADPGNGKLRLNNATQNLSTVIRADLLDINGADMSGFLDIFDAATGTAKGQIRLSKLGDPTKFILCVMTARASPSGYRNLTVSVVASSAASPFANGDVIVLSFVRAGDAGVAAGTIDIGSVIGMSQTANLVTIGGIDYLKTGVLAASTSYTSAPLQNSFADTKRIITSGNWIGVASGGGIMVAITASTAGQISYDGGNTWSPMTLPASTNYAICYGNGVFLIVGNSYCATSSNGIDWTSQSIPAQNWSGVIWSGAKFVAVGGNGGSQTGAAYSSDGITWSSTTLPSAQWWGSLASDGAGNVIATLSQGNSNVIALSTNHGVTWVGKTLPQAYTQALNNCAFGSGVFTVVTTDPALTSANCVFTSPDGVTWTTRTFVSFSQSRNIAYVGGLFLIVRSGVATGYTSPDGITWTPRTLAATHSPASFCVANGGRYVGVSNSTVIDVFTAAYGRGYHIALYADQQSQQIPLYMRMN